MKRRTCPGWSPLYLRCPSQDLHLLVVDDNSPDGTGQLAEELAARPPGPHQRAAPPRQTGSGHGLYQPAFSRRSQPAPKPSARWTPISLTRPRLIPDFLAALQPCDVAIGSRYVPGGSVDNHWPPGAKVSRAFGNLYARAILGLPLRDATGGYRAWKRASLLGMPLERIRSNGYAFQVEMAYIACRLGFKFEEIPFYFADRRWGHSKMSFRIQREAAIRVWQILYGYRDLRRSSEAV